MTEKDLEDLDKILSMVDVDKNDAKFALSFYNRVVDNSYESCPTCGSQIRKLFKMIHIWVDKNKEEIEGYRKKYNN